jgi:CRP-like cAMP-binding protein
MNAVFSVADPQVGTRQLLQHLREEGADARHGDAWRLKVSERLALAENSWFAGLSSAIRHDLLRAIRVRLYESDEEIFQAGAPVRAWMVCLSGSARVATSSQTGRSLTLRYLRPGHWFGDLPAPRSSSHTHRRHSERSVVRTSTALSRDHNAPT